MGGLVTLRRHAFPLLERRILYRFGVLPLLGALRPAHFGSLVARVSYGVVSNCEERTFLLGEGKNVFVNPIFQAEMKRSGLGCFGCERSFSFDKSRNTGVENFKQPIRYAVFHLQDGANPHVELLPIDVLILSIKQALPGDAASFIVGALTGSPLKSSGRAAYGLAFGFIQAGVPRRVRRAACPLLSFQSPPLATPF